MPGTPVLRYGDEIGMGENLRLRERMAIRTPMQWSDGAERRVSPRADRPVRPGRRRRGPYGYEKVNVEAQRRDPDSLLRWTTAHDPAAEGMPRDRVGRASQVIRHRQPEVLAMLHHWRDTSMVCVHNLAPAAGRARLKLGDALTRADRLLDHEPSSAGARGVHQLELEPLTTAGIASTAGMQQYAGTQPASQETARSHSTTPRRVWRSTATSISMSE